MFFPECPGEYEKLQNEINQARQELTKKGFNFKRGLK